MNKKTVLTLAALSLGLPTSYLMAEEPSVDAGLQKMILQLTREMAVIRQENRDLRKLLAPAGAVVSAQAGGVAAQAEGAFGVAQGASDGTQAAKDQPIPLHLRMAKSYLTFSSADGNVQYTVDGRIMLDGGFVDSDRNVFRSNTELRRVRLAIKTKLYRDWAGEFDIDFAENDPEIKDMWIAYTGVPHTVIKVGNQKPHFSMAELTTHRYPHFLTCDKMA